MPIRRPPTKTPSGTTNDKTTSAIAKQRSARLHRFQSEIQSFIRPQPPGHTLSFGRVYVTAQRVKNSTEVWPCDDKETVISPKVFTRDRQWRKKCTIRAG